MDDLKSTGIKDEKAMKEEICKNLRKMLLYSENINVESLLRVSLNLKFQFYECTVQKYM